MTKKRNNNDISGVLPVYKPQGMTSHDVVDRIRRLYHLKRIGHTGTLDPNAEGVLIICLGKATKFISYFSDTDKSYRAEIIFGVATDTDDITGDVLIKATSQVTADALMAVLPQFTGTIDQKPPIYSAIKKDGMRYYDYARRGIDIDIPSRKTRIDEISLLADQSHFPDKAVIDVICASGTYVRSLCRDIGTALDTPACMGRLLRTAVGGIAVSDCLTLDALEAMDDVEKQAALLPVDRFLTGYPQVKSTQRGDHFIKNGAALYPWNVDGSLDSLSDETFVAIVDSGDSFIGIGKVVKDAKDDPHVDPIRMLL